MYVQDVYVEDVQDVQDVYVQDVYAQYIPSSMYSLNTLEPSNPPSGLHFIAAPVQRAAGPENNACLGCHLQCTSRGFPWAMDVCPRRL